MKFKLLALVLSLLVLLSACNGNSTDLGYKAFGSIEGQEYQVAFREDDVIRDVFTAGMMVLSEEGYLDTLSTKWFGDDRAILGTDENAAEWLLNRGERVFIAGYYKDSAPFCFEENGAVVGFDAEMLSEICSRLGWQIRFQEIERGTAAVELDSGNVDCVVGGFGASEIVSGMSTSPSYISGSSFQFVAKADSGINRTGELKGKILATVGNSIMGKTLQEENVDLIEDLENLLIVTSEDECFEALDAGLCDAILVSSDYANYYIG